MISIIIQARAEKYLNRTIKDIQAKAKGDIEIIVILEGSDDERLPKVKYIYNPTAIGMKYAINQGVKIAIGEYLMKKNGSLISVILLITNTGYGRETINLYLYMVLDGVNGQSSKPIY